MESSTTIIDAFAAAEKAHGASNPDPHRWADRDSSERYVIAFERFERCETRDGKQVETIVGRHRDGSWSREWLFPPEAGSRGWRAQQIEFIEAVRAELKRGDILVMELGAAKPLASNPDKTGRPFTGSHHRAPDGHGPVAEIAPAGVHAPLDENEAATAAALEAEQDEIDQAAGEADDVPF